MPNRSRQKGDRREREVVKLHIRDGLHAERIPRSGAAGGEFSGDVQIFTNNMRAEVKGRANGEGFKVITRWLADNDLLFVRQDRADPLVVMPWKVYAMLAKVYAES